MENLSKYVEKDKFGAMRHYNKEGLLHREDGPAVEYADGGKIWYVNGKLHRTDGPAVENADGSKSWSVNDKLHRIDGPAIEYADKPMFFSI